jgi:hypothetical protein
MRKSYVVDRPVISRICRSHVTKMRIIHDEACTKHWIWIPDEKRFNPLDPEDCQYSHLCIETHWRVMISVSVVREMASCRWKKPTFLKQSGVARRRRKWPLIGATLIQFPRFPCSEIPEAAGQNALDFDFVREHGAYVGPYWAFIGCFWFSTVIEEAFITCRIFTSEIEGNHP